IKVALALYNKVLPPTLKVMKPVEPLEPGKSPLYVNTDKRPWLPRPDRPRRAGLSAFGFGGSNFHSVLGEHRPGKAGPDAGGRGAFGFGGRNFHAVLEEHRPVKAGPDWDGRVQIIALSAVTSTELADRLDELPLKASWNELCQAFAATRAEFDRHHGARLMLVAQRDADLDKLIAPARIRLQGEPAANSWASSDAADFGRG